MTQVLDRPISTAAQQALQAIENNAAIERQRILEVERRHQQELAQLVIDEQAAQAQAEAEQARLELEAKRRAFSDAIELDVRRHSEEVIARANLTLQEILAAEAVLNAAGTRQRQLLAQARGLGQLIGEIAVEHIDAYSPAEWQHVIAELIQDFIPSDALLALRTDTDAKPAEPAHRILGNVTMHRDQTLVVTRKVLAVLAANR